MNFSAAVVAPTFNNAGTLCAVAEAVLDLALPLVIVNDGSTDGTEDILDALSTAAPGKLSIESHAYNRGKGAALLTGFARAASEGYTHAATLDTDGQLPPEALPALIDVARAAPRSLVLGVRKWRIDGYPRKSVIGRRVANAAVWLETGLRLADTQCGLRVYPLEIIRTARCKAGGFAFETEIIVRAAWAGWSVVETPAPCTYLPPGGRISHFRPWRDSLAAAALHARLASSAARRLPRRLTGE